MVSLSGVVEKFQKSSMKKIKNAIKEIKPENMNSVKKMLMLDFAS